MKCPRDMDNVMKALTSGNESGACRAVGRGVCKEAAPELVKNKMVQQVELLREGIVVGNVLIYLAKVNGELAIVMGSIIKKSPRYVSAEINATPWTFRYLHAKMMQKSLHE